MSKNEENQPDNVSETPLEQGEDPSDAGSPENQEEIESRAPLDPELELDDLSEVSIILAILSNLQATIAQHKALTTVTRIHPQAGTFKNYMDMFVTPVLFKGLQELTQRRPDMPIEYLAYYLLDNNPALKKRVEELEQIKKDLESKEQEEATGEENKPSGGLVGV